MLLCQNVSFIRSHLQIRRGSSPYRFSQVYIVQNALQTTSSIARNSRGSVLSFGKNSHYHSKLLTRVATSAHSASGISRMSCMRFTCYSLKSGWWWTYQMTHLATQSIPFPEGWRTCVVYCRHGIFHIPVVHEYGVVGVMSNGPSMSPNCMSSMHVIKYKYFIHPPVNISNMCF